MKVNAPGANLPPVISGEQSDTKAHTSAFNRLPLTAKLSQIFQPHHPVNENMREVWQRLDELNARQSQFTGGGAALVSSMEAVATYLAENHCQVAKATQQLMVQLDLAIADVHHALPYGRGNVLVRAADGTIDTAATAKKVSLDELTKWLGDASPKWKKSQTVPEVTLAARRAACAMVTGSGTCANYVYLLSLMALDISEKNQHCFAQPPTLTLYSDPILEGRRVDHAWLTLSFQEPNGGKAIDLVLDPWAKNNRPMLAEHCAYQEGKAFFSLECGQQAAGYQQLLKENVKTLQPMLRQGLREESFQQRVQQRLDSLPQSNDTADTQYSMTDSYAGFVDHDAQQNAAANVITAPERRPTLLSGNHSVLANRIEEKLRAR
ncbi:hypothetical protein PMPD1_2153 [Paramixta manurensis]|uniref:Uncharacterized protein n=1 Tax=Paramixta manurensis TaxID=2740817 RepID=A0A6M8UBM7_9GAMM|nr:hypothetical protein PMPD1_2153 [Erwiniaceae bacterium PD-1]